MHKCWVAYPRGMRRSGVVWRAEVMGVGCRGLGPKGALGTQDMLAVQEAVFVWLARAPGLMLHMQHRFQR